MASDVVINDYCPKELKREECYWDGYHIGPTE